MCSINCSNDVFDWLNHAIYSARFQDLRWDDGSYRYGQQPHGWRYCCLCGCCWGKFQEVRFSVAHPCENGLTEPIFEVGNRWATPKNSNFFTALSDTPEGRFLCVKPIGTQWINVDMFLDYLPQKGYNSNWTIQFNFTKVRKRWDECKTVIQATLEILASWVCFVYCIRQGFRLAWTGI